MKAAPLLRPTYKLCAALVPPTVSDTSFTTDQFSVGGDDVLFLAVRPEVANHQWRKIPPGELSIDPVADERLGWATGRAGAS